jgi:hypothetical protein
MIPRPDSFILPRANALKSRASGNLGVAHQNFWLANCCATIVAVAAQLESFYKPGTTVMQQLDLPLQATQPDSLTVLKYPRRV